MSQIKMISSIDNNKQFFNYHEVEWKSFDAIYVECIKKILSYVMFVMVVGNQWTEEGMLWFEDEDILYGREVAGYLRQLYGGSTESCKSVLLFVLFLLTSSQPEVFCKRWFSKIAQNSQGNA